MHLMHHDFFFFKQKTSYEMRISDWSSDVCSSDLRPVGEVRVGEVPVGEVPVGEVPVGKASSSRTPFVYHRARKLAQIAAGCSASARRDGRGIEMKAWPDAQWGTPSAMKLAGLPIPEQAEGAARVRVESRATPSH